MGGKVLFVASVTEHINAFHLPYMQWFKDQGYEVHVSARNNLDESLQVCDKFFEIPFCRSPFDINNFKAYKQLKKLLYKEKYDIIHCHTPMASALCRLAAKELRRNGLRVIYTAHGYHFFKGAPLIGWLLYYPVEYLLSAYTDIIITINNEDYENTITHNFRCKNVYLVPGIGVNTSKVIKSTDSVKHDLRKKYGYKDNEFLLFYAAEFIPRKNHELIIRQVPRLKENIPGLKVVFAGRGDLLNEMKSLAMNLNINEYIDFLGYRTDISQLVAMSDIGISSSKQEGLGITVAEDMFAGLPVVVSIDRGHKEMVRDGENGFFFDLKYPDQFADRIIELYRNQGLLHKMGRNAEKSIQKFSIENSLKVHAEIYKSIIKNI